MNNGAYDPFSEGNYLPNPTRDELERAEARARLRMGVDRPHFVRGRRTAQAANAVHEFGMAQAPPEKKVPALKLPTRAKLDARAKALGLNPKNYKSLVEVAEAIALKGQTKSL